MTEQRSFGAPPSRRIVGEAGRVPARAPAWPLLCASAKEGAHGGTMGSPMLNNLAIHVFELAEGNIRRVAAGERIGTVISTPKEK